MVQTLCFLDNEYGDQAKAADVFETRIGAAMARRLRRGMKPVRLIRIRISPKQLHTVSIVYTDLRSLTTETLDLAIYKPSERARARERSFESVGETFQTGLPRRGRKSNGNSELHATHERVRKARKALRENGR